jgi:hypothetical protein
MYPVPPAHDIFGIMKSQVQQALTQVASTLKETFVDLSDSAKEKTVAVLDRWLDVFPELESMGLQITNFGVIMTLMPALEVELSGPAGLFDDGRLMEFRDLYKDNKQVSLVLKAIHTAKLMYHKLGKEGSDEIFVKIRVKVPPEVGVYFGRPAIP